MVGYVPITHPLKYAKGEVDSLEKIRRYRNYR